MSAILPVDITLHQRSRILEIEFENGQRFSLPFEFLRVHSPSAEVRGHGPGQAVLQTGKEAVTITDIRPVGQYGLCPTFSDGHDTGIYTWDYLYELGAARDQLWAEYLAKLAQAGIQRSPAST